MKKNVKEERNIEPKKLTKKEIKELQKQFPELEDERLQNKLEMLIIVFGAIVVVGTLYLFYLVWNYEFIGVW